MRNFILIFLTGILTLSPHAQAQDRTVPQSQQEMQLSFAPVSKKASPAVVNIYTKRNVKVRVSPFMNDPLFQQFFGGDPRLGGLSRDRVVSSLGSGVIVGKEGTVVTCHHVIKDSDEITVVLSDKREFDAKVALADPKSDLAVLKLELNNQQVPSLEIADSDKLEVGDLVLAIGNPFGVGQTVTSGIISAVARPAKNVSDYQFFIQTDAAINPGNSGGALVDIQGRLIGVNTAIFTTSGGSNGIGFAIPANMVKTIIASVEQGKDRLERPWLGVEVQTVTREIAESLGMQVPQGVLIREVHGGSPAEKAGLKVGDVILAVDGKPVENSQSLNYRTTTIELGQQAILSLMRNGKPETVTILLATAPDAPRDERVLKGNHPLSGVTVANLTPALAVELGIDPDSKGVVVTQSKRKNALFGIGLRTGDVILQVNNHSVSSTKELEEILAAADGTGWDITFMHEGKITTLAVRR